MLAFCSCAACRGEVWGNECTTKKKEPLLLLMAMAISRMVPLIENLDTLQVQMNERVKRGRRASERATRRRERKKMDGTARERILSALRERVNKIIGSQVDDEAAAIDWRKNSALLVCRGA
jgi:hypothetical protein